MLLADDLIDGPGAHAVRERRCAAGVVFRGSNEEIHPAKYAVKRASVKTLGLVAKRNKPEAVTLARQIRERFPDCLVLAEPHLADELGWPPTAEDELGARVDLAVVLGGDGTLISAARILRGRPVPILGINLGSLGFLTEIPQSDLFPMLAAVLEGRCRVDSRMKLVCRLVRRGEIILEAEVLNDVVISKGALARITDYETHVDEQFVTLYKADGVIVSTPTGSTGYCLSANGPIVNPALDCALITPICPHSLTQRSVVLPSDRLISIYLRSGGADVYLTVDGQGGQPMEVDDRLDIQKSPNRVLLVRNPHLDYFAILRQKLRWGER